MSEMTPNPDRGGLHRHVRRGLGHRSEVERAEGEEHQKTPSTKPQSPMRLTMNAFLPASDALCFWYQ